MNLHSVPKTPVFLMSFVFIVFLCAFYTPGRALHIGWSPALAKGNKGSPPPHAKAHGYRAKYTYRYYPSVKVYYDFYRKAYFYLEGNNWRISVSLPSIFRVQLGDHVTIEMDSDKPHIRFDEHKRKYPPGQLKKKKKKKWD